MLLDESYFVYLETTEVEPKEAKTVFTNTIYENFFGSNTTITKLYNKETGNEKFISKHVQKMGPVILNLKNGRLFEDWEELCRNEVSGYY